MVMRILVVEDDRDMNSVVARYLASSGFKVDACFDAKTALEMIFTAVYDVVIMDIMLPLGNGIDIVKRMREGNIASSVLFLTAKDAVEDRILGLDAGGDDYMTKPFSLEELAARIRALTRRVNDRKENVYRVGDLTMDIQRRCVKRGDKEIALSMREFSVLEYLMRNAGFVLTREQIEQYIWDYDYVGSSNVIEVYISNLRKKIDADYDKKLIHTIRSVGYTIKE